MDTTSRPAAPLPRTQGALYALKSGKNSKALYFLKAWGRELIPGAVARARREQLLESIASRPDREEIEDRAAYCCKLDGPVTLGPDAPRMGDLPLGKKMHTYYYDAREIIRYFPAETRWRYKWGDVTERFAEPTVVKSRPVDGDNAASVLLNLNKTRHFLFVDDPVPFREKADLAVFRGKVQNKPKRMRLFEALWGNPLCDLGDTDSKHDTPQEWKTGKLTIRQQLGCKFALVIEGNDVASGLKWVMSSNTLAMMPRPEYETWFMEGRLVPGVHYVELAPDYSDFVEKARYYIAHPEEAEKILAAARTWTRRFRDARRELLVALRVIERYARATSPVPASPAEREDAPARSPQAK